MSFGRELIERLDGWVNELTVPRRVEMAGSAVIALAMRICSGVSVRGRPMATPRLWAATRPEHLSVFQKRPDLCRATHKLLISDSL